MTRPRLSIIVPLVAQGAEEDPASLLPGVDIRKHSEMLVERADSLAEALNRGFARARGDVMGFLRPGESLLQGVPDLVLAEVRADEDRLAVMGRAAIVVDEIEGAAVPHPAEYGDRAEHLKIWERRFDTVAYSSLFWHRDALASIGKLDVRSPEATAFELVCRLGMRHHVYAVDTVWSYCRVDTRGLEAEADTLDELIAVSRRYWGHWLSPLRWQCETSHRRHASHAHDRARHHARRAEAARSRGSRFTYILEYAMTWLASREMARGRLRDPLG